MKRLIILCIPLIFLSHYIVYANFGKKDWSFRSFSVDHGLSQYDVTCIVQDKIGYIWMGTYDGLNRYDGFNNKVYRHEQDNKNSLPGNRVLCLSIDIKDNIWIGTEDGGLGVYSIHKKNFIPVKSLNKSIPKSITSIYLDGNRVIYGTATSELLYSDIKWTADTIFLETYNIELSNIDFAGNNTYVSSIAKLDGSIFVGFLDGELFHFTENKNGYKFVKSINNLSIENIFVGNNKQIWVSTFKGLKKYKYLKDYEKIIDITPEILSKLDNKRITSVIEDDIGKVWISTYNEGLYVLNNTYNRELILTHFSTENSRIGVDNLSTLFLDNTKTLWIGSHRDGMRMIDLHQKEFYRATFLDEKLPMKRYIPNEFLISSCFIDKLGKKWIGVQDHGLFLYDKEDPGANRNGLILGNVSNTITDILEDHRGNLWFSTWYGLYKLSEKNRRLQTYNFEQINPTLNFSEAINNNTIFSLCEDKDGNIWLGNLLGIYKLIFTNTGHCDRIVRYIFPDGNQPSLGIIFSLFSDPDNRIIFAGSKGTGLNLIYYNKVNDSIIINQFSSNKTGDHYLSNNNVWSIAATKNNLWVGTDGGLNLIEKTHNKYAFKESFLIKNGLPSNKISSIEVDFEGKVWMGTGNGLACLDPENLQVKNYYISDGLQSNIFTQASTIDNEGKLYFGGITGLNYFNPDEIKEDDFIKPNVQIISLYLHQNLVEPAVNQRSKNPITSDIPFCEHIDLDYFNNYFSFEFLNFQYSSLEKNEYEYKLEGYDLEWIKSQGTSRIASYSRVPHGEYTFYVRLVNSEASTKSIALTISTPPWLRWWAYVSYFLLSLGIIIFLVRFFKQKTKHKNDLLIEQHKREQEHHLNEMKIKFFINISHELRTPLTLLIEPINILKQSIQESSGLTQYVNLAHKNSLKLLGLITQLLDFRKTETGNIKFNPRKSDLVEFLESIFDLFNPLMEKKSIDFSFVSKETTLNMCFDKDIIDKITSNLLSNAIKFTPIGGKIDLILELKSDKPEKSVCIKVKDNGEGISADSIDKIFDRFYQSSDKGGFGIGLAFSKNLAALHGSDIFVESTLGEGSCFSLELPMVEYEENDEHETYSLDANFKTSDLLIVEEDENVHEIIIEANHCEKKIILLVEDNDDLRNFLAKSLSDSYEVLSAINGKEAYDIAIHKLPDLIITDIMMPVMDGFTFAEKIVANIHTNHIPIIFLTAKDKPEDQIKGVDSGAVDYIVKPFSIIYLQSKIKNLLNTMRLQQDKFRNKFLYEPEKSDQLSMEGAFIQKAHEIIKANINNSDFNVTMFCELLGVSRMQLHRKIKGVLGQSTTAFISSVRLKHAAELLKTGNYNVSESMYEAGFDNPSYFTKSFKKMYGKTPSEYID